MRWDLSFRRQALGDPFSEGRRVWEWIQQIRPLHPSLDLWRPTADSPQEAEQAPPHHPGLPPSIHPRRPNHLPLPRLRPHPGLLRTDQPRQQAMLSFNRPASGDAGIVLMIGEELGAALDTSEDLADTLMHTTANTFTPGIIGTLTRKERPRSATPPPYRYLGLPGVFRTLLVFLLQAAFVKFRSSRSTSFGARYPRAE